MSEAASGTGCGSQSADAAAVLRARLEASRDALLAALATLTEREFASEIEDGRSVIELLAALAPAERAAAGETRPGAASAGAGATARGGRSAMVAPQVVHDLSGARRRTLLALDAIEAAGEDAIGALDPLRAVAEREEQAAAAIRERFGNGGGAEA